MVITDFFSEAKLRKKLVKAKRFGKINAILLKITSESALPYGDYLMALLRSGASRCP